jgi:hypothetical protein
MPSLKGLQRVERGYYIHESAGIALIVREVWEARARAVGPVDDPNTWLLLSDEVAFRYEFLPPDFVLVVNSQLAHAELAQGGAGNG